MGAPESSTGRLLETPPYLFDGGSAFVLAAGGLRRLHGRGADFLGRAAADMFWRDVLDLVHPSDLPRADRLVSDAVENPGITLHAPLSVLDASGDWRPLNVSVQNVVEAPGDEGLVVAHFDDASPTDGHHRDGQRS